MSGNGQNAGNDGGQGGKPDFTPITSQEQFNAAIQERISRAESKVREQFADYDALKEKAGKYDEAQNASKTEAQKAEERIKSLEDELSGMRAARQHDQWVSEVSQATGVPADLLRGSTKEEIEAHANSIANAFKSSGVVRTDGNRAPGGNGSTGDWLRDALMKR